MSEIRKVAVKMSNLDNIQTACKAVGLEIVKQGNKILVRNHGIYTFGREVELVQKKDGSYELQGDVSERELEKIAQKIAYTYSDITVKNTLTSEFSFNEEERVVDQQRQKIRIKYVAYE